jgi:hypothetical protein
MTHLTTNNNKTTSDELSQHDLIIQTILKNIPALARGNIYLVKDLIGSVVWKTLSKGMRIDIGVVVSQKVESRLLPLTYAGKTSSNKRLYRPE